VRVRRVRCWMVVLLAVVTGSNLSAATMQEIDARQTVVLANRNVPESIELAVYYMEQRGIPTNHLCVLDLPVGETIARWFYENNIREPVQAFLREQNLIEQVRRDHTRIGDHENQWRTVKVSFRYVVAMYGIPLRIAETRPYLLEKVSRLFEDPMQRDGAAVDSELSTLLWEGLDIKGVAHNPLYNTIAWPRNERQAQTGADCRAARRPDAGHCARDDQRCAAGRKRRIAWTRVHRQPFHSGSGLCHR
jgi:uncharacterized protein (TIGR03790 family)